MLDTRVGGPASHASLTLFPLLTDDRVELPYRLLSEALTAEIVRITEVGEGTVPELLASNAGKEDVLVLDGEQLVGARQNRMTNRSLILGAGLDTRIPVSCMERGRWTPRTGFMEGTPNHSPSTVRRKAREAEVSSVRAGGSASVASLSMAQADVWDEISMKAAAIRAHVPTGALDQLYAAKRSDLDAWADTFIWSDGQVGVVAFHGTHPLGMDVIGAPSLYAKLHRRLVRGYIMDALTERRAEAGQPGLQEAQQFLDRTRESRRSEAPTLGLGEYLVLCGDVIGGELTHRGRLVHLSAFAEAERG